MASGGDSPSTAHTAAPGVLRLDDDNPWPGLASYDELSATWFHGRDRDSAELLRLIQHSPFVVLYGKSGLGKSSMLQAGVFPELRKARFLPVMLRLDYTPGAEVPPLQRAMQLLHQAVAEAGADAAEAVAGEGLWAYLQRRERPIWTADNFPLTPVLVFDQFEEVFSRGGSAEHIKSVLDQLGDLVGDRLSTDLAGDRDAARRLNLQAQQYRVVLSFRSDFLAEVESWEKAANLPKRESLHLKAMSREQALVAVEKAGAKVLEPGIAERIVDFVLDRDDAGRQLALGGAAARGSSEVEPVLLSLTCFQLNRRRQRPKRVDAALLDSVGRNILLDFYREALAGLPPRVGTFIEDQLIQGGRYRSNYPRDEALASGALSSDELLLLTERRLLRVDPQGDVPRIELIHDRLVGVVYSGKLSRLQREREQREQAEAARSAREERERERAEHAEQQRLGLERERKIEADARLAAEGDAQRLARQRNFFRAAVVLLLVAVTGAGYFAFDANRQTERVVAKGIELEQETQRANAAAATASAAAAKALAAASEATKQRERADLYAAEAAAAASEASGNAARATEYAQAEARQRLAAEQARARAEVATRRAESLRLVIEAQGMLAGTVAGGDAQAYEQLLAGSRMWPGAQTEGPLFDALVSRQHLRGFVPTVVQPDSVPTLVAFSPDSRWLVAGHEDGSLSVRDPAAPQTAVATRARAHGDVVSSIDVARGAALLVSASHDGSLRLWKLPALEPVGGALARSGDALYAAAISPDGTLVAAGGEDKRLRLWHTASGAAAGEPIEIDGTEITALAFSGDGKRLAIGSVAPSAASSTQLSVMDVASRRVTKAGYAHNGATSALAFAPGDNRVATGGADNIVRVRNVAAETAPAPRLGSHQDEVYAVAFSADGRWVASGGADGKLLLWQANGAGAVRLPETGHSGSITGVAFSADGRWLASAGDEGSLRLWPLDTDWSTAAADGVPAGGATALALSAGGERRVYGRDDGGLMLRDAAGGQRSLPPPAAEATGTPLPCQAPPPSRAPQQQASRSRSVNPKEGDSGPAPRAAAVRALASAGDARVYSAHDDGTLRRWDIEQGPTLGLRVSDCALTALAVGGAAGDAARLTVANLDNRVLLLDAGGRRLGTWSVGAPRTGRIRALALDRSGGWIAVATADRRLSLIDTRIPGKTGGDDGLNMEGVVDQLTALAFSPDGRWLVSGSSEGQVRLWDVAGRGALGKPQPAHSRAVAAIAFSADGRRFHSSTLGGALREWPAPADWAPLMCAKLEHNPSRKSWRERISAELPYQCPCPGKPVAPDVPGGPPGRCPAPLR